MGKRGIPIGTTSSSNETSGLRSELRKAKQEAQHWKLSSMIIKYQNLELKDQIDAGKELYNELFLESEMKKSEFDQLKKSFETLIVDYHRMCDKVAHDEQIEEKPSTVIYKRKREAGDDDDDDQRVDRREIELESYKTKCQDLAAELKEKESECAESESKLKSLMVIKDALDEEIKEYKTRCCEMEDKITGFVQERKGMFLRDKMASERVACLEEEVKKMKAEKSHSIFSPDSEGYVWKRLVNKRTCRTVRDSLDVSRDDL